MNRSEARQMLKAQTSRRDECRSALVDPAEAAHRGYWTEALAEAESLIADARMMLAR